MASNSKKEIIRSHLKLLMEDDTSEDENEWDLFFASESSSSSEDSQSPQVHAAVRSFMETIEEFTEADFKSHMRLKKSTVDYLIERFQENATSSFRNANGAGLRKTTGKKMIYIYIWYICNTITYRQLGNLFGVAKSTAWSCVNRVVAWLISISHEVINWPTGVALESTCQKFRSKKKIPGVIGAIDCTHITINAPIKNKEGYFDRKRSYSIVLQAVVDADKKFIDVFCGEPGSLHDSRVLRRSGLYRRAESECSNLFPNSTFLLADSAYPPKSWLVPPFKDYGTLTLQQKRFNKLHSSARIVVENAFGILKQRFRRLLKYAEHRNIHVLTHLVASACVLHNICIIKEDLLEDEDLYREPVEEESLMLQQQLQHPEREYERREMLFQQLIEENII